MRSGRDVKRWIIVPVVAVALLGLAYFLFPGDYDAKEVESDFASLEQKGFDVQIVRRLGIQYGRSDGCYRMHFLAKGYQIYLRNPNVFKTPVNRNWDEAVAEILKTGAACSDDWDNTNYADHTGSVQPTIRSVDRPPLNGKSPSASKSGPGN